MVVRIIDTIITRNVRNEAALTFPDDSASIFVLQSGSVRNLTAGGIGIEMAGPFQSLSVAGSVIAGGIGIFVDGKAFNSDIAVERGGFVSSLQCNADGVHLRNSGHIGTVDFNNDSTLQVNRFENLGFAGRFLGSSVADVVNNAGTIPLVIMAGGDDVYDGSASRLARADIAMGDDNDTAIGSRYGESIDGGNGDDTVHASGGDDTVIGGFGSDQLDGGAGTDLFDAFDADNASIIDLGLGAAVSVSPNFGVIAEDSLLGFENAVAGFLDDTLLGSAAANSLDGRPGSDSIAGLAGDDRLVGGSGSDTLSGGAGRDQLSGGDGRDILSGGPGADRFIYLAAQDSLRLNTQRDTITDFTQGEDKIDLSRIEAGGTIGGFPFRFIGTDDFTAGSPGTLRYAWAGGNLTHVFLNTDNDVAAESAISIAGHVALTAADFVL